MQHTAHVRQHLFGRDSQGCHAMLPQEQISRRILVGSTTEVVSRSIDLDA
jgi:hypothetical protein